MIDFNVFVIYESGKGDFFEVCGFMEAGWVSIGRPPGKVSCCGIGGIVHSE